MGPGRRILIRGGTVVTGQRLLAADILIDGERIAGIVSPGTLVPAERVLDAPGCYILPGVVDAHTHIQLDTGLYHTADNWEVGTQSAAFGGVTTVIDFANQIVDRPLVEALEARRAEASSATIDYSLHMVLLRPEDDLDQLRAVLAVLLNLGVPSIKLFTTYRPNYFLDDAAILRVFQAMPDGMIAMVHCENDSIVTEATQRLVASGRTGWRYHAEARPEEAEAEATNRVLYLAALARARVYIAHNSTAMATSAVNQMRTRGNGHWDKMYCETCPQYVLLHDAVYQEDRPEHYILQPPLRRAHHMESLKHFVEAGLIDVLSTDSCDYAVAQKTEHADFTRTPGGLPGLETLLPLMVTAFQEKVGWVRLMQLLAENPARLFGLYPRKGVILPGSDADLVIYDPRPQGFVHHTALHNLAGYNPFEGMPVQGCVRTVLSRGEVIVDEGQFFGGTGRGVFLPGSSSIDPV
jgi:dihydropyrimidinase